MGKEMIHDEKTGGDNSAGSPPALPLGSGVFKERFARRGGLGGRGEGDCFGCCEEQIRSHKVRLGKGMKETSKMVGKSLDIKRGSREMRA